MKILITFYHINNFGGIINNQEALYAGLKELGHDVRVKKLMWKEKATAVNSSRKWKQAPGSMGMYYDQELGWKWNQESLFSYKGKANIARWKEYASKFDLIIWQIPVPSENRENAGNMDWLELYNIPVKQVVYVHDGNLAEANPHLYEVAPFLTGAIGVHPCAYHSLKDIPLPRAMAFSPQMNIEERVAAADASTERRNGWFSLQTFKGWKHVEDIVRAVPYMNTDDDDYDKVLAGGGIGRYYMTSPDKTKPQFHVSPEYDPNCRPEHIGKRIWDVAIQCGMQYLDYIHNDARDKLLHRFKFLIDPSWSKKYRKVGDHFNRVVIDGLIGGAAPIARNFGISTNVAGQGELFIPGKNYVMIPWNVYPKDFAAIVNDAMTMPESRRKELVDAGRELLPHFDYRATAQAFIDLAEGRPAGYYKLEGDKGLHNDDVKARSDKLMKFFQTPKGE